MEVWSKDNNREISMEAVEKLRSLGYRSYSINKDGEIEEVCDNLLKIITLNLFDNFILKK